MTIEAWTLGAFAALGWLAAGYLWLSRGDVVRERDAAPPSAKPKAMCGACGREVGLRNDGTFRLHPESLADKRTCWGSHRHPDTYSTLRPS